MKGPTYRILFKGELTGFFEAEKARQKFLVRFKINDAQAARLFSGKSVVLKRHLDPEKAQQIRAAIAQTGFKCEVEQEAEGERPPEKPAREGFNPLAPESRLPPLPDERMLQRDSEENSPFVRAEGRTAQAPFTDVRSLPSIALDRPEEDLVSPPQDRQPPSLFDPQAAYFEARRAQDRRRERETHHHQTIWRMVWCGLVLLALIVMARWMFMHTEVQHGPGVVAPRDPVQTDHHDPRSFVFKDYNIKPLAEFDLEARVLGVKRYRMGREAELSPIDLAMGWGRMSDESVLQNIKISQHGRFYFWRVRQFPIPRKEIETHSANMHMIPANSQVEKELKQVRTGHVVRLRGKLVYVSAPDGWRWKSSTTRNDTGAGACEVIYVEDFTIMP